MAEIMPFRGILYNQEKVKVVKKVVAPPYDVITPEEQERYYNKHKNNIIRIILGKEYASDTEEENRYTRAAGYFKSWQDSAVFSRDKNKSIYFYRQKYRIRGKRKVRDGFIALVKLEDFGSGMIFPHERTFLPAKADRYELMKRCQANFSPIFSLYSDPDKRIDKIWKKETFEPPLIKIIGEDKIEHEFRRIDQPEIIKRVSEEMKGKPLFIADGHHRYETALKYRNMMQERVSRYSGKESFNYVMMYFSNMNGEGADILPVNRLVSNLVDFDFEDFLKKIGDYFVVEEFRFNSKNEAEVRRRFFTRLEKEEKSSFGIYTRERECYYLLILRDREKIERSLSFQDEPVRDLDVIVLHDFIFGKILNIKVEDEDKHVKYDVARDKVLDLTRDGKYQMAFFVNETKIEQVKAVAEAGIKMPKKSTFFYPKLLSGLVINKIVPEETSYGS